jgi:hypothetical protein
MTTNSQCTLCAKMELNGAKEHVYFLHFVKIGEIRLKYCVTLYIAALDIQCYTKFKTDWLANFIFSHTARATRAKRLCFGG